MYNIYTVYMYVYIYVCMYIYIYVYVYIYIHIDNYLISDCISTLVSFLLCRGHIFFQRFPPTSTSLKLSSLGVPAGRLNNFGLQSTALVKSHISEAILVDLRFERNQQKWREFP